jgi:transcriptional regulator with XRE-family HTH domain
MNSSPLHRIALQIRAKRQESDANLRTAAEESDISAATLSRLERGLSATLPDASTLTKLASWLGTSVDKLLENDAPSPRKMPRKSSLPDVVDVHLRAEKNLPPETAKALSQMFRALYEQATRKPES